MGRSLFGGTFVHRIVMVLLAFLVDFMVGDPYPLIKRIGHPVIYIGNFIKKMECLLRLLFSSSKKQLQLAGFLLLLMVAGGSSLVALLFFSILYNFAPELGFIVETFFCYQLLALRSLQVESYKVYLPLISDDLEGSRTALSYIVGRETNQLSKEDVTKATVETIAENTTDGVIAPLFYMFLFGGVGGIFYKSVNTLDSMVGYRNETYQYFGTASAKMDDILNFIPSRIAAFTMLCACYVLQLDYKNGAKIFMRDRFCHKSPNSAQTESVVAGALGVQLGGTATYFGKVYQKDTIGDNLRTITPDDILLAHRILMISSVIFLLLCTIFIFLLKGYYL